MIADSTFLAIQWVRHSGVVDELYAPSEISEACPRYQNQRNSGHAPGFLFLTGVRYRSHSDVRRVRASEGETTSFMASAALWLAQFVRTEFTWRRNASP
jgi:hypothetical protein